MTHHPQPPCFPRKRGPSSGLPSRRRAFRLSQAGSGPSRRLLLKKAWFTCRACVARMAVAASSLQTQTLEEGMKNADWPGPGEVSRVGDLKRQMSYLKQPGGNVLLHFHGAKSASSSWENLRYERCEEPGAKLAPAPTAYKSLLLMLDLTLNPPSDQGVSKTSGDVSLCKRLKRTLSWLVSFSGSVVSDSLWPHRPQHARLPCPSPPPRVCSNSCS